MLSRVARPPAAQSVLRQGSVLSCTSTVYQSQLLYERFPFFT